ncbi:MAG: hypothetical protein A2V70_17565 [Planctomycetes bacterium RBG_13_63_9]|nr:MAG: hypothetical protein A2V70_17565 [Planctomycetes bacterium RBG_13_63_9]
MKCLIVDDSRLNRELLYNMLSPYGQCDKVVDGEEAIEAFEAALEDDEPYDLVCLDIMMPGMDGHQVLSEIREMECRCGVYGSDATKVIMTTALNESKHCLQSFKEGCEAYVTKPIDEERLLGQVRSLLGGLPEKLPLPRPKGEHSEPAETARASSAQREHAHYLIVDDDRLCRKLLEDVLSAHGRCTFGCTGEEAIAAVRLALEGERRYDLICLDIMMPGSSGHDALREIRRLEAEHGVYGSDGAKVIMITALNESKHCLQSFKEGCECYITKPINNEALLAKMRELDVRMAPDSAPA